MIPLHCIIHVDDRTKIAVGANGMNVYRLTERIIYGQPQTEWYGLGAEEYPPAVVAWLESAEAMIAAQARDLRESLKPDTATEF